MSPLQNFRQSYIPPLPLILKDLKRIEFVKAESKKRSEELKRLFPKTHDLPLLRAKQGSGQTFSPLRIGVVLSGGQAAGGHNVISGLFDALQELHKESRLFGFLNGPTGIISGTYQEITKEKLAPFRNQGGFDLIGSGRTKIETEEQLLSSLKVVQGLALDGLVIIGGDDSNTNAAVLAEYFLASGCQTKVIGVPKTIDGDLKNEEVAISFGFDTACKVYAEMIGNIQRDALSSKKYYHFVRLMGRSASHITLECALQTHPNLALIGEELFAKKMSLKQLVREIVDLIIKRFDQGKNYGVILIPEGLIEFIPEMATLLSELANQKELSSASKSCFEELPEAIQKQLSLESDSHGNLQLSSIETEKFLIELVTNELRLRSFSGKFSPLAHFFGYEGRSSFPSNFDCNYCYSLGRAAALLLSFGFSGYMCAIQGLTGPTHHWTVSGAPFVSLMKMEMRKGKVKPVIEKALVDLKGRAFQEFAKKRGDWQIKDEYRFPGPIQFYGDPSMCDTVPLSI